MLWGGGGSGGGGGGGGEGGGTINTHRDENYHRPLLHYTPYYHPHSATTTITNLCAAPWRRPLTSMGTLEVKADNKAGLRGPAKAKQTLNMYMAHLCLVWW